MLAVGQPSVGAFTALAHNTQCLMGTARRQYTARRKRPRLESDACERWRPSRHSADERDRRSDSQESDTRHYGAVSSGTGKTHLAIAIARSCIRAGLRGGFFNTVDLVNRLEAEARAGRQGRKIEPVSECRNENWKIASRDRRPPA
jgi:IstB-like ATP binding protein